MKQFACGSPLNGEPFIMVLGYHVIFCAYGFWLPNDPRGSWSDVIHKWELLRFGPATKVNTRRSVANRPHDRQRRDAAKRALKYPPVHLTGEQARSIASGFAVFARKSELVVWACSILPEHIHMVVGRHRYKVEQAVNLLKGAATRQLNSDGLHPLADHPRRDGRLPCPWAQHEWKVFLDTPADIERAIAYVEGNPVKEGKRRQQWKFVMAYDATRSPAAHR